MNISEWAKDNVTVETYRINSHKPDSPYIRVTHNESGLRVRCIRYIDNQQNLDLALICLYLLMKHGVWLEENEFTGVIYESRRE